MKLHGTHRFAAPRERVFEAIRDPRVLMAVIPGCESVEQVGPDEYIGRIMLRLPGAVGSYRTTVRLVDVVAPERAGMDALVEGAMGSITGRADFTLAEADDGTNGMGGTDHGTGAPEARTGGTVMDYRGSGTIDGPLARLDSRFAERLAESLIAQGLRALDLRLTTEGSE